MPRRRKVEYAREVGVDLRFQSPLVQSLINSVMRQGKKSIAIRIVYGALDIVAKKAGGGDAEATAYLSNAFEEVVPRVAVRAKRVGGSVYQIPTEVRERRGRSLGLRWIIEAAKGRPGKTMSNRLADEIIDAREARGGAVKRRMEMQRMAEANRAFSHYAW